MIVEVPFGDGSVTAQLPDRTFVIPSQGGEKLKGLDDLSAAVDAALDRPLESPPIEQLVQPGARVVIAFDDPTVPCFSPVRGLAINAVLKRLEGAGVPRDTVTLICANSLHRKFRAEELGAIIGPDLVEEFGDRCFCHDAEDTEQLVYLGKTQNGHDVEISRHAVESDLCVYITAAHNRGFSGGWKSVCVGLSTFRSIRHHHTPDGMSMSVHENRMHAMLDEMGAYLESAVKTTFFKIDAVEANPIQTGAVFAGTTWATRKAALDLLARQFPARRGLSGAKYDVIVQGVPNWSPYAIFSRMNPILTLVSSGLGYLGGTIQALGKPGCTVIMATPCPEQWDDVHHPSYRDVWENVLPLTRDPYEIEAKFTDQYATHPRYIEQYRNGYAFHPVHGIFATQPLRRLKHAGRIIVAGIEDPAVAHHLGFESAPTIEAALAMAAETHGSEFSLAYAQHPAAPTKVAM